MTPFKSLDAVDVVGAGISEDLKDVYVWHTLHVSSSVVPSSGENFLITLEGSLNGTDWFQIINSVVQYPSNTVMVTGMCAARHVRANLQIKSAGVTDVTAWIGSARSD